MRVPLIRPAVLLACVALVLSLGPAPLAAQDGPYETPEGLVRHLYDLVTFPAGSTVDLDALRATFVPEATIVLRTSRTAHTVMSVDGFIADWDRFLRESEAEATGFTEAIQALVPTVIGDVAHVLVLYETTLPGRVQDMPGIDSFHLVFRDGRWWITGIVNEIPGPGRPVPDVLRGAGG